MSSTALPESRMSLPGPSLPRRPRASVSVIRCLAAALVPWPARQLMTRHVISPPSIDALRKDYSITSSASSNMGCGIVAKAVREWVTAVGAKTADIEPGSPWENVTSRASTRACAMNCSMAKSSTRCARPRSSSKVGGATSMLLDRQVVRGRDGVMRTVNMNLSAM